MRKYGFEDIGYITTFEKMTKSSVVDYISDDGILYFVVISRNFYELIGRDGINIRKISEKFGKKIKVYRYSKDIKEFTKNLIIKPCEKIDIVDDKNGKSLKIKVANKDKAIIIGREGKNLEIIKKLMDRQFGIKKIQIM